MSKCRKCNVEIPDGQELCNKCEKENNESYLDSLFRSFVMEGDGMPAFHRNVREESKEQEKETTVEAVPEIAEEVQELLDNTTEESFEEEFELPKKEIDLDEESKPETIQEFTDHFETDFSEEDITDKVDLEEEQDFFDKDVKESEQEEKQVEDTDHFDTDFSEEDIIDKIDLEEEQEQKIIEEQPNIEMESDPFEEEVIVEPKALFQGIQKEEQEIPVQKDSDLFKEAAMADTELGDSGVAQEEELLQKEDNLLQTEEKDRVDESAFPIDLSQEELEEDYNIFGNSETEDSEFDQMLREIDEDSAEVSRRDMMHDSMEFDHSDSLSQISDSPKEESEEKIDEVSGNDILSMISIPEDTEELSFESTEQEDDVLAAVTKESQSDAAKANEEKPQDDDILDLINSIYNSDYEEDGKEPPTSKMEEEKPDQEKSPGNIEDVFSDTLSVMNSLNDVGESAENSESEQTSSKDSKKKKEKKTKKEKDGQKAGFFKRVFGNIKVERSEEEIAQLKEKVYADAEAKQAAQEEKAKLAAEKKEEKKRLAAEEKAEAAKKKQEKEKKKAEAAKLKKEAKDRKKQEIQSLIDAIDEDEGRINRVGAAIVFIFFVLVAGAIILGTNGYSYFVSMDNARKDFGNQRYNDAYNEISGIKNVREEDETFVLQVETVMMTYKQLNSFQNFYSMGLYPQALDSLLKGMKRYDKYSGIAAVIDVDKDLNNIRGTFVERLDTVFGLSEQEAIQIAAIEDPDEYTAKVYEIADRFMKE